MTPAHEGVHSRLSVPCETNDSAGEVFSGDVFASFSITASSESLVFQVFCVKPRSNLDLMKERDEK